MIKSQSKDHDKDAIIEDLKTKDYNNLNPVEKSNYDRINQEFDLKGCFSFTSVGTINDDVDSIDRIDMNAFIANGLSNEEIEKISNLGHKIASLKQDIGSLDKDIEKYDDIFSDYRREASSGAMSNRRRGRMLANVNGTYIKQTIKPGCKYSIIISSCLERMIQKLTGDYNYDLKLCRDLVNNDEKLTVEDYDIIVPVYKELCLVYSKLTSLKEQRQKLQDELNDLQDGLNDYNIKNRNGYNQLFFNIDVDTSGPKLAVIGVDEDRKKYDMISWVFTNVKDDNLHYIDRQNRVHLIRRKDNINPKILNFVNEKYGHSNGVFIIRDTILARPEFITDIRGVDMKDCEKYAHLEDPVNTRRWKEIIEANLENLTNSVFGNNSNKSNFRQSLNIHAKQYKNKTFSVDLTSKAVLWDSYELSAVNTLLCSDELIKVENQSPELFSTIREIYSKQTKRELTYDDVIGYKEELEKLASKCGYSASKYYTGVISDLLPYGSCSAYYSIKDTIDKFMSKLERDNLVYNNISLEDIVFIPIENIEAKGSQGYYHFESDLLFVNAGYKSSGYLIHPARTMLEEVPGNSYVITDNKLYAGGKLYSYVHMTLKTYNIIYSNSKVPGLYVNDGLVVKIDNLEDAGKLADLWVNEDNAKHHGLTDKYLESKKFDVMNKKLDVNIQLSDNDLATSKIGLEKAEISLQQAKDNHKFDMEEFRLRYEIKVNEFILSVKQAEFNMLLNKEKMLYSLEVDSAYAIRDFQFKHELEKMKYDAAVMDYKLSTLDNVVKICRLAGSFF